MNFVGLCQRVAREGGVEGTISSVASQVGMNRKIVEWVSDAWTELQTMRPWLFMRETASFNLVAGKNLYSVSSDFALVNVRSWCATKFNATDVNGTFTISLIEYADFQRRYQGQTLQSQRPSFCAVAPGYMMVFDALPQAATSVINDYWRTSQVLVSDEDEPSMNEDWHLAIVYKALRDYAEHEESPEIQRRARRKFLNIFNEMCITELPAFNIPARPLAWGRRDA